MCEWTRLCQDKDWSKITPPMAANLGNTNTTLYNEVVAHAKELDTKLPENILGSGGCGLGGMHKDQRGPVWIRSCWYFRSDGLGRAIDGYNRCAPCWLCSRLRMGHRTAEYPCRSMQGLSFCIKHVASSTSITWIDWPSSVRTQLPSFSQSQPMSFLKGTWRMKRNCPHYYLSLLRESIRVREF